jgi:hypothetical protein
MPTTEKDRVEGMAQSWMRDLSLRHKLIAITMMTSVGALLLAGAVFMAWEWTSLRRAMVRDLSTHAEILADNCKARAGF